MDAEDDAGRCPDCGSEAPGMYCAACGQDQRIDARAVGYWIRTFLDETIALDGRLIRTLRTLATRPGLLTVEWIQGRRTRWSHPFRIYLLSSIIFFAAGVISPLELQTATSTEPADQAFNDAQKEMLITLAPQIVFVLVLALALLLKIGFAPRRFYVEHLAHAFHLQSMAFLVISIAYVGGLAPDPVANMLVLLMLGIPVYAAVSARRVYRVGLIRTVGVTSAVMVAYIALTVFSLNGAANALTPAPSEELDDAVAAYWSTRARLEAGMQSSFGLSIVLTRYQRLPEYLHTPLTRAQMAQMHLDRNRWQDARHAADLALARDPDHPLALGVAARAVPDSLGDVAGELWARFLAVYPERSGDEELVPHAGDLEEMLIEATEAIEPGPRRDEGAGPDERH